MWELTLRKSSAHASADGLPQRAGRTRRARSACRVVAGRARRSTSMHCARAASVQCARALCIVGVCRQRAGGLWGARGRAKRAAATQLFETATLSHSHSCGSGRSVLVALKVDILKVDDLLLALVSPPLSTVPLP